MNDMLGFFMHITAPSSYINHNSDSFYCLQQRIKKPVETLNTNINGMSFIINQLNSRLLSICDSDSSFSNLDIYAALNIINQLHCWQKPLNRIAKNQHVHNSKNISEFQILYSQFIKHTINCIKNLILPDNLYMQIYASLTPVLCLYLKKLNGEDINISPSDFNLLIRFNEESVEAIIHFLSEEKFETTIEKLISHFSSNICKHSSNDLYQSIVESLESIKQLLIPRPQKSDKYQAACNQIEELKYKITLYSENNASRSISSIFVLISHFESTVKSLKLGFLSKESLKSLFKFTTSNECNFVVDSNEKMPKKFIESFLHLYLQEIKSLHKNKLVSDAFVQSIEDILNSRADYREFLKTIPSYYENSVISGMARSFNHFEISTTNQLTNFDDCYNMYIDFLREADDFHKGSKLHYNLMKNLIIAQTEVIFATCISNNDENINEGNENDGQKINETVDSIIPLINEIITIMNDLTTQKQSQVILTFLAHVLKITQLAFTIIKNPDEIQIIKNFLAENIPSYDSIDNILGIKQKIGDLIGLVKLYNVFQSNNSDPKSVGEIYDLREMEENFQITNIQKQRQIPEMILRQLDIIFPYKDFPSKYDQFTEMIGGSVPNFFNSFDFDQDLFNISNSLLSVIISLKNRFEINGKFFYDWLRIIFSLFRDDEFKKLNDQPIPKFSEIIPFCNFSFIFSKTILTLNISRQIVNQQLSSNTNSESEQNESESEKENENQTENENEKEQEEEEENDKNENLINEAIESLRSYVFTALETLNVDICTLYAKTMDVKDQAKNSLNLSCYRRIKDQMDFIELDMVIISEFNNLTELLSKKFPDEHFDYHSIAYINYALSVYSLLVSTSKSNFLSDQYRSIFEKLKFDYDIILDIARKSRFYTNELDNAFYEIVIPYISEANCLIHTFDLTSLTDITSEYVYAVLDYFNSKDTDSIEPETLVSILHLNFICEKISPKANIFQNINSISSILFTLFDIKQQPPQLLESFEKLKETAVVSFINYNTFDIVNFLHQILAGKFGFIKSFHCENELNLVIEDDYIEKLGKFDKYSHISEIIPQTVDMICDLRPYVQAVRKEVSEGLDVFDQICSELFEKVEKVISPFIEPNDKLSALKEQNMKLMDDLRASKEEWKLKTEEAEKLFYKTRKNCHKTRSQIESAILDEKKLSIEIEQKKKHLIELHQQIQKKESEMAFRNEKTPPEMKQKQKTEFMGTIHALRELVGPVMSDQEKVNELTKKLSEMNEENEKLKKEIQQIDSQHSVTREDEIDLLIMNENNNFSPSMNMENIEEENQFLEKRIAETEASNDRIKRKLKKINAFTSKRPFMSSNDNTPSSKSLSFISGPDKALADFLHSSRPYNFNSAHVNYESFMAFKNSTMEKIAEMMMKRQKLIEERDAIQTFNNGNNEKGDTE